MADRTRCCSGVAAGHMGTQAGWRFQPGAVAGHSATCVSSSCKVTRPGGCCSTLAAQQSLLSLDSLTRAGAHALRTCCCTACTAHRTYCGTCCTLVPHTVPTMQGHERLAHMHVHSHLLIQEKQGHMCRMQACSFMAFVRAPAP